MNSRTHRLRVCISSAVGVAVGGLVHLLTLLNYGWHPGRTAISLGYGSNFFDLQGRALLEGRLAVPDGSLGIEGFVLNGQTYMYFPPFPALVRIPILLVTDEFDGRLTVAMMMIAWVIFAVMCVHVVWLIRRCLGRTGAPSRLEAVGAGALIAALTGGTVLTFDAALPWVYHEVYAWASAIFMVGVYWLIRYVLQPSPAAAAWVGGAALAAVMTRTTGGFALALVCIGVGAFRLWRPGRIPRSTAVALVLAGVVPVAASVALNWAKFRHPYLFPLQDQVWTAVNSRRREALVRNGGTITGPQFLPSTLYAYLRPDGIRFTSYFPWVSLPADPARALNGAFLDQTYRTGSVTAFMPLLTLLTLISATVVGRARRNRLVRALLPALLATVLLVGPVLMYGYITHRYTSEFIPLLVTGGIIGFWMLWVVVERHGRTLRLAAVALVVLGAGYSLVVQGLTAHTATAMSARGDDLEAYVSDQLDLPGTGGLVIRSGERLPAVAPTDELFVLGDCGWLYLSTGDQYDRWALVQQRPLVLQVTIGDIVSAGTVPLFDVLGPQRREIAMEVDTNRRGRFVVTAADGQVNGSWFTLFPNSQVRLGLGVRPDIGYAEVSSTPGGHIALVPWLRYDVDTWVTRPGEIRFLRTNEVASDLGLGLQMVEGQALPLCQRALERAR